MGYGRRVEVTDLPLPLPRGQDPLYVLYEAPDRAARLEAAHRRSYERHIGQPAPPGYGKAGYPDRLTEYDDHGHLRTRTDLWDHPIEWP
jgi:hypothetical protein